MNDDVKYRDALAEDEDALVELWWTMQSSHLEYDSEWYADIGEEAAKASWRKRFKKLLGDANAVVIVATSANARVGMIVASFANRPPVYAMERMVAVGATVVHPDCRRKGIFKGMVKALEERARAKGINVMKLSVHHRNGNAMRAYSKSGFVPETVGMLKWID